MPWITLSARRGAARQRVGVVRVVVVATAVVVDIVEVRRIAEIRRPEPTNPQHWRPEPRSTFPF